MLCMKDEPVLFGSKQDSIEEDGCGGWRSYDYMYYVCQKDPPNQSMHYFAT